MWRFLIKGKPMDQLSMFTDYIYPESIVILDIISKKKGHCLS